MVEHIGSSGTTQSVATRSAKVSEDAKAQDTSAKDKNVVQISESRKRDRFERSGEVWRDVSSDESKGNAAFDKKQSAAQANDMRSYDRFEFSDKDLSGSYTKPNNDSNVHDMSETDLSAVELSEVRSNEESGSSEEIDSSSQSIVSDDSSESVDTNRLYQYTDTELKDFLLDGSITQSEYDAEIAKREL